MSKPAPKNNFTQTLLIAAVVFLGVQLFMTSQKQGDPRPAGDYMAAVRKEVEDLKAESAKRSLPITTILSEWEAANRQIQLRAQPASINSEQSREVRRYQNELGMDLTIAQYKQFHEAKIEARAQMD